jgi:predicted DNA-binding transcriptional regulator AlpA
MEEMRLPLGDQVYNEEDMLALLGIGKETLDDLRREKNFPYIGLTSRARVYLTEEVLDWLKKQARR